MQLHSLAASLGLLLGTPAWASESETAAEEMIVTSDTEIAERRQAVVNNLKALGYRKKKGKDGRTTFSPAVAWKPTVIMDDDAYIVLKRTPIRIDPPGDRGNMLRYLWCLPPFTITKACIQTGGWMIGKRKLAHAKETVVRATDYELRMWRATLIAKSMDKRVNTEVPALLASIWERGQPDGPQGLKLTSPAERRSAIFKLWSSRACTPEGERVRGVVADFVHYEVQRSATPASPAEIANANADNRCESLDLSPSPPPLDGPGQAE
jgi:hypothetical protein